MHRLLVATQNGFLYVYDVSEIEGGDCKLIVKHNLRNVETQPIKIQGNFEIVELSIKKLRQQLNPFPFCLLLDVQPNGSPLDNSPSTAGSATNHGPSYASTVKAGTSDDDQ